MVYCVSRKKHPSRREPLYRGDRTRRDTPPRSKSMLRVKECARPDCPSCLWTHPGADRRRWCSMDACGNRAKTVDYRRRLKGRESLRRHQRNSKQLERKRMKLNLHEWGTGDRTALLIHGLFADHQNWYRVGPALAQRGYRVNRSPTCAVMVRAPVEHTLPNWCCGSRSRVSPKTPILQSVILSQAWRLLLAAKGLNPAKATSWGFDSPSRHHLTYLFAML